MSLFATTQQPHSTDIFTTQKMLPIAKLTKLHEGTLAYKVNSNQLLLSNFLQDVHVNQYYQFRYDSDLRIPLHAKTHAHQFIRCRAIKTWNSLPDNLRSSSSLHSFKTKFKFVLALESELSNLRVSSVY